MLSHVEEKMMEKFIREEIRTDLQEIFFHRMKEGKDETIEGKLLEFADKLDQFYESFAELKRGNTDKEFVHMYQIALNKLLQIDLPVTVSYFRDYILEDALKEETQINIYGITNEILIKFK